MNLQLCGNHGPLANKGGQNKTKAHSGGTEGIRGLLESL